MAEAKTKPAAQKAATAAAEPAATKKSTATSAPETKTAATTKAPAAKAAAKSAAPKKAPAEKKTPAAKKTSAAWNPGNEERYNMIEVAAYYLAERDGFAGNPVEYWAAAELQVSSMLPKK